MLAKKTWCSLLIVSVLVCLKPQLQAAERQQGPPETVVDCGLLAGAAAVLGSIATAIIGVIYWRTPILECEAPRVRYMSDSSAEHGPGCPGYVCYWPDSIPLPVNVSRTADGSCQSDARIGFAALYVFLASVGVIGLAGTAAAISYRSYVAANARAQASGREIELGIVPAIEEKDPQPLAAPLRL